MKLKDLAANPDNPRSISPEKLKALKRALEEFGDLSGIVFNRRTQHLVGGHQRQKIFGKDAEIVIETKHKKPTRTGTTAEGYVVTGGERFRYREVDWDAAREKAANIAANKGAGEWDLPKLSDWLKDLDTSGFDLDLTMFDADERQKFLGAETKTGLTDPDAVPDNAPTRCKLGDLWTLGSHRLLCGDSTDVLQVERLMGGEKADMVFTDPPYGVKEETMRASRAKRGGLCAARDFSPIIGDESTDTAVDAYRLCESLKIPLLVFWGGNYFCGDLPPTSSWLVWDKRDGVGSDDNADCELAWTNRGGPARIFAHLWKGVIKASEHGERRVHPTQKPVALAEWAIAEYPRGRVTSVVDLFLGSGSTLIACEKTGRRCFGMEIDPHYCDVIIQRWQDFTGEKAKLEEKTNGNGKAQKEAKKPERSARQHAVEKGSKRKSEGVSW